MIAFKHDLSFQGQEKESHKILESWERENSENSFPHDLKGYSDLKEVISQSYKLQESLFFVCFLAAPGSDLFIDSKLNICPLGSQFI